MIQRITRREASPVEELIAFITHYLEETGTPVAELAGNAEISRMYLYKILRGESEPSLTVSLRLARAMNASIGEICPEISVAIH